MMLMALENASGSCYLAVSLSLSIPRLGLRITSSSIYDLQLRIFASITLYAEEPWLTTAAKETRFRT
jgi:hypothetical protein